MNTTLESLQRSTVSLIGALAFTALLVIASAPVIPIA
jgi:hypothetical protein